MGHHDFVPALPPTCPRGRKYALLLLWWIGWLVPAAPAAIEHVIHISVDGLRGDLFRGLIETQPGAFRTFTRLRAEGAVTFNARCDFSSSSTIPNHTSMLTGLPLYASPKAPEWQQHGYVINYTVPGDTLHDNGLPARYKPSVFDRLHDRGRSTMMLASKEKFILFDRSYGAEHGAPDAEGVDHGRDKIDFALVKDGDSSLLLSVLIARMNEDFPAYTFLHIFDPDAAGHLNGWGSLSWQLGVKHADSMIELLLAALELRPALKATTALVITSDHGGGVPWWTHVDPAHWENYNIPVIIWGPGVPGGVDAHELFSNRRDPGTARPDNDAEVPPLRNGDTGNICLALLGLPPVPGSLYVPEWSGGLQVTTQPEGVVDCAWPLLWAGWSLETSGGLDGESWVPATAEPVAIGLRWHVRESAPLTPQRFYRLRAPQ